MYMYKPFESILCVYWTLFPLSLLSFLCPLILLCSLRLLCPVNTVSAEPFLSSDPFLYPDPFESNVPYVSPVSTEISAFHVHWTLRFILAFCVYFDICVTEHSVFTVYTEPSIFVLPSVFPGILCPLCFICPLSLLCPDSLLCILSGQFYLVCSLSLYSESTEYRSIEACVHCTFCVH